jgi:hypothetical protein
MLEGESVVIRVPDRQAAIEFLEGQHWLGRVVPFCVLVRKPPIWMIHARIIQGPFELNKLYSFQDDGWEWGVS